MGVAVLPPIDPRRVMQFSGTRPRWTGDRLASVRLAGAWRARRARTDGSSGRVHRCRLDGGRRDLLAARRGGRGRGRRGVALLHARRRRRDPAGLFVLEDGSPLPLGGRDDRVRAPRVWRRAHHRDLRLDGSGHERGGHEHGRRVVRQLRGVVLPQPARSRLDQVLRSGARHRDDPPEHRRVACSGTRADGRGDRGDRNSHRVRSCDAHEPPSPSAGTVGISVVPLHRVERGAHVLRLPRLRCRDVHRRRTPQPEEGAPARDVPRVQGSRRSSTSRSQSACSARSPSTR